MFTQQWKKWRKPPNISKLSSNSNKKATFKIKKIELNQCPISNFKWDSSKKQIAEFTKMKK